MQAASIFLQSAAIDTYIGMISFHSTTQGRIHNYFSLNLVSLKTRITFSVGADPTAGSGPWIPSLFDESKLSSIQFGSDSRR